VAGKYESSVRYFYESDMKAAEKVAEIATKFFSQKKCPVEIKLKKLPTSKFKVQEGQIEIWVSNTCE
jgi:hypothetical protein